MIENVFFAAMHFFDLAQYETIETTHDNTFSIYTTLAICSIARP